jgi:hypothetical protein
MHDFKEDLLAEAEGEGDDHQAECDARALLEARSILKDPARLKAAREYVANLRRAVSAGCKGQSDD